MRRSKLSSFRLAPLLCAVILIHLSLFAFSPIRPAVAASRNFYSESWAVLIGINNYVNERNLSYAIADAKSMARLLVERFGFKKRNVVLLVDDKAKRELSQDSYFGDFRIEIATLMGIRSILGELNDPEKIRKEDRILIFYAGHGQTVSLPTGGEMGYIIPMDGIGKSASTLYTTSIPMSEFRYLSGMMAAKHVLFLLDTCFGGLATSSSRSLEPDIPKYIDKVSNIPVRHVITAGGKGEQVWERPEWGHSAFTLKLLEALGKGVADGDGDGFITGRELANYLRPTVTNITGGRQTPQEGRFFGEGEFIFNVTGGTANLIVKSDPRGADVYLNGEFKGATKEGPVMILELRPAPYKLVIRLEGYYDYEKTIALERGEERKVEARLTPMPARLSINVRPEGAAVYIDGQFIGITGIDPLETSDLSPGTHYLKIVKTGYKDHEQTFHLAPGEMKEMFYTLQSNPGSIVVYASPAGADVYLEGDKKGTTGVNRPVKMTDIEPGLYRLRVVKEGYRDHEETVLVKPGKSIERPVNLEALPSILVVSSVPAGGKVSIDGKYVGNTIIQRELSPGYHNVVIEKEGYEKRQQTIFIEQGKQELISAFLKPETTTGTEMAVAVPPKEEKPIAAYGPSPEPNPTILNVFSDPPGAKVYVDDKYTGATPATIKVLPPGGHKITLMKEGYYEWEQYITLRRGEPYNINAELMAETPAIEAKPSSQETTVATLERATLNLTSSPAGADIYIDDEIAGQSTPSTMEISPGSHVIVVRKEGYRDWMGYISPDPGERKELFARLVPLKGGLRLTSEPSGARIFIDNEYTNRQTPAVISELAPGTRKVTLKKEGYLDWTDYIVLRAGETEELPLVVLVREPLQSGEIRIVSRPQGGWVYLNGEPTNEQTPATLRGLKPGAYVIAVRKEGYPGWAGTVEIGPGENPDQEVDLGIPTKPWVVLEQYIPRGSDVRTIILRCLNITREKMHVCQSMPYTKVEGTGVIKISGGTARWSANIYYRQIDEIKILDPLFGAPNGVEVKGNFDIRYPQPPRVYIEAGIKQDLSMGRLYLPCKGEKCRLVKSALEAMRAGR